MKTLLAHIPALAVAAIGLYFIPRLAYAAMDLYGSLAALLCALGQ